MKSSLLTIHGTAAHTARAQSILSRLSGVVAAEFVPGRNALRIYTGEDMTRQMLLEALENRGLQGE